MNDGITFTQVTCLESMTNIIASASCTVPISTLVAAPFNLQWGSTIYATISAVNIYGTSVISTSGSGAVIVTVPDAPMNLANNVALTTGSMITITWAQGLSNGGAAVIDFIISYKLTVGGTYTVLASAIT